MIVAALRTSLSEAGDAVAGVFGLLPGHEIVSGTIDGVGNAIAVIFNSIGLTAIRKPSRRPDRWSSGH